MIPWVFRWSHQQVLYAASAEALFRMHAEITVLMLSGLHNYKADLTCHVPASDARLPAHTSYNFISKCQIALDRAGIAHPSIVITKRQPRHARNHRIEECSGGVEFGETLTVVSMAAPHCQVPRKMATCRLTAQPSHGARVPHAVLSSLPSSSARTAQISSLDYTAPSKPWRRHRIAHPARRQPHGSSTAVVAAARAHSDSSSAERERLKVHRQHRGSLCCLIAAP